MKYVATIFVIGLLLFFNPLHAADITLAWTNATQNTDETLIPATGPNSLVSTTVFWGACLPDDTPAPPLLEQTIPTTIPGNSESMSLIVTTPGRWCFVGVHQNQGGNVSDWSNVVFRIIANVPMPPDDVTVTNITVYYVIQQPGRFILLPVGTIPNGTDCDITQYVNGFFAVDVDLVTWTGTVRPLVVVAQCG